MSSRWPSTLTACALATLLILLLGWLLSDGAAPELAAPMPRPSGSALHATNSQPAAAANLAVTEAGPAEAAAPEPARPLSPSELPATAWTRVTWLQGRHAMPDFLDVFLRELPAARAGDPEAMLELAFAIGNCHMAASFTTRADLDAFARSRPLAAAEDLAAMAALIPDCRRIAEAVPEGMRIQQWSANWIERAANGGNALARYLMVNPWERSDVAYVQATLTLAEAVATGNPWALREAAEFVSNHPAPARDDPYQVEASAWLLLACRTDPACDASILDQQIRWAQLPAYAEQIRQRAAEIRRQLDAGDTFDFDNGWRAQ